MNAEHPSPLLDVEAEESALGPYLRAVRARLLTVVAITLAALCGAAAWLSVRSPAYEAHAQLLVTPLPPGELLELSSVLRDSGDPTRTVQTAATLVDSRQAATLAARRLGPGWSVGRVEKAVEVGAQGESNILAVSAKANSPTVAAQLANEFARAALGARLAALEREVSRAISQVRKEQRVFANTRAGPPPALAEQLAQLRSVQVGDDPSLSLFQAATPPGSPSGAPAGLILAAALLAGLALGALTAVLLGALYRSPDGSADRQAAEPAGILQSQAR